MHRPRPLIRLAAAAVALVGFAHLAPRASADLITLEYKGNTGGSTNITFKGEQRDGFPSGPFTWQDTNDTPDPSFPPTIKTFCIELEQGLPTLTPPTATFRITTLEGAPTITSAAQADAIRALYGNFYDFASDSVIGGNNRAFQVALWELLYDFNNINLLNGDFISRGSAGTINGANTMLNGLGGGLARYNASGYELVALVAPAGDPAKTQDEVQDHITARPKPIPAPPALLLAGIGALALLGRARVIRRAPAAK